MKYLKKFEISIMNSDLNYILEDEIYYESDAIKLLKKIRNAIDNGCIIDNIDVNWMNRTPLIKCSILSCYIKNNISKYYNLYAQISTELLNAGANIDYVDCDNKSALIWAADRHHYDVMELLIEEGADWNIINKYELEFLDYLTIKHSKEIMNKYPTQYEKYKLKKEANKFNI